MRAARIHRYGSPDELRIDDVPRPDPGPDDLLVEVHAASVNPIDCKIRSGGQRGAVRLRLPAILGLDVSGVVAAAGRRVRRFKPGDAVFSSPTHRGPGTYADYTLIHQDQAAPKPATMSHEEAATIPLVGLTTWQCFESARLRAGQKVLIPAGSGGVGSFAIQLAKARGAVVTTTTSARNVDLVRSLGADRVIDYGKERVEVAVKDQDVVLDTLGHEHQAPALSVLRRGGCLVSIVGGLPEATARYGPNLGLLVTGLGMVRLRMEGLRRGVRATMVVRDPDGAQLAEIGRLCDSGAIRAVVDRVYPLEQIAEAHRYSETGRVRGKIAIRLRPSGAD